ncbi:unnamed protein product [Candidula unifasciata]|uniref:Uncharacterized protein n=1 Tax=Candidula unifasciata TaxID=100452 RepID=A0A8S3Z7U4_9EUPU|nr:unnamed protein product [Candidula unifasciata]
MEYINVKLTRAERENLMSEHKPHYTGFSAQPLQHLTHRRRPRSMLDIECHHFLRTSTDDITNQRPSLEHRLWLQAGTCTVTIPTHQDKNYDSNMWRNFRRSFQINYSAEAGRVTDAVAALYPVNIPPPSHVKDDTFDKFLGQTKLFDNDKFKSLAIQRAATEIYEFQKLRCRSQARNPPLNEKGDILPPENYKKYAQRCVALTSPAPPADPLGQKTDIFGRRYTPRSQPALWKLSYRLNHPRFDRLQEEIQTKRQMVRTADNKSTDCRLQQMSHSPDPVQ